MLPRRLAALLTALLALAATAVLLAAPVSRAADVPGPGDDFARLPDACYANGFNVLSPCVVTSYPRRPYLVAWGDSHMLMYVEALERLARQYRVNFVALIVPGCPVSKPFAPSEGEPTLTCDRRNLESLDYLKQLTRTHRTQLVVGGYWAGYRRTYREIQDGADYPAYVTHIARLAVERSRPMMRAVARLDVPVALMAQAATVDRDAVLLPCLLGDDPYRCDQLRSAALPDEAGNRRFITRTLGEPIDGATVVDPSPLYCEDFLCRSTLDGDAVFYDDVHLGAVLAARTTPWFRPLFRGLVTLS